MPTTSRKHYKRWVELIPKSVTADLIMRKKAHGVLESCWENRSVSSYETEMVGEVSSNRFEIIYHLDPSENLKKLQDLGYNDNDACRILDALGLE